MSSRGLVEIAMNLIQDQIKSNIDQALLDVRTDRADNQVTTEAPKNYYNYSGVTSYRCPMVMIVPGETDFQKDLGANHVNALIHTTVAVVVEDKNLQALNIKAWRYQAALDKILDQAFMISTDNKVKIVTVVKRARLSPEFTVAGDQYQGAFQKEVSLEVDVRHFENL